MIPSPMSTTTRPPTLSSPSALRARVLADVARVPSRSRPEGRRRAGLVYGLAVLAGLLFFEAWGGLAHSDGRPRGLTVAMAGGATVLALGASLVGWWRGRTMLGRPWQLLVAAPLLVPGLTLGWLLAFHDRYVEPFARVGWRCLLLSLGSGAALLAAAVWLRKGSVTNNVALTGAALGATAGAWSAVVVDLWCPLTNVPHALVGHVAPIVTLTALGALLGHVVLRWRPTGR